MRQEPSFFKTITIRDEYGLVLGRITPTSNNSYIVFFYFIFFEKMDTGRGEHWGANYIEGEGCCDHAHLGRGVCLWVSQRPYGACPRPFAYQDVPLKMSDHVPRWN
jgi:hypothetical protein